jgi:TrmH family RNA methyltransferase
MAVTAVKAPVEISAADNPLLVRLRRLKHDGGAYRRIGAVWLEGDHLCRALLERGGRAAQAVVTPAGWADASVRALCDGAERTALVGERLFAGISQLESPPRIGFVLEPVPDAVLQAALGSVVLDRLQDPGNVGSILRSAAAFGVAQVVALKGTAALWSPKVLRAAMGAHFALRLVEGVVPAELSSLALPIVATSSHTGVRLPDAMLPRPCAWLFGHEGQGVDAPLLERAALQVRIPQPGGEESLNVAAAAAVCLYEATRRP